MSKKLQGYLSSVTKISNEITHTAFFDFNDIVSIERLFEEYKEKINNFQEVYNEEIQELQDDAEKAPKTQEWFSEKMEEISNFVNKTEKWINCRKTLQNNESITSQNIATNSRADIPTETLKGKAHETLRPTLEVPLLEILRQQNKMTEAISLSQERLLLPKGEIESFNGKDVTKFRPFMAAFDYIVASRCSRNKDKLYYLLQYTYDKPKDIVRSCLHMDETEGYQLARHLLQQKYGDEFLIANSYIQRLECWPSIKNEDAASMDDFATFLLTISNYMKDKSSLNPLNSPKELQNLAFKLPFKLRERWRAQVDFILESGAAISFSHFVEFIQKQSRIMNRPIFGNICDRQTSGKNSVSSEVKVIPKRQVALLATAKDTLFVLCLYCQKKGHKLNHCFKFSALTTNDKIEFVLKNNLCFGCLANGHKSSECTNRDECKHCKKSHPTSLHIGIKEQSKRDSQLAQSSPKLVNAFSDLKHSANCRIALPVLPVYLKVKGRQESILTYAALDTCSTACFVTEKVVCQLKAEGEKKDIQIATLLNQNSTPSMVINNLEILDIENNEKIDIPVAYSAAQIPVSCEDIPSKEDIENYSHLKDLPIDYPKVNVGLLLGVNSVEALKPLELVEGGVNEPYAIRYKLGWSISGPLRSKKRMEIIKSHLTKVEIDKQLEAYFNRDFSDSNCSEVDRSYNDKVWEKRVASTKLLCNNHYEVPLPFSEETPVFPNNIGQALKRFDSIRKRCEQNQEFYKEYSEFMDQMIRKRFAERVPNEELNREPGRTWFITHHAVYHKVKQKLRIVFNCSLKYAGTSLNDKLLQGPDLANNLLGVLLRFRAGEVAMMADIEKMFYQVQVPETQRDFLRFLWFDADNPTSKPVQYRLTVHVFGAISSPSCANYALRKTAYDNESCTDKNVTQTLLRQFYVDDMLCSVDYEHDGITRLREIILLCERGGFNLTQVISNKISVLNSISSEKVTKSLKEKAINRLIDATERALGVIWNLEKDVFQFKIKTQDGNFTKRIVLSVLFSIYDPFGFIGPALLPGRLIFQKLCRMKTDWDEIISPEIASEWKDWMKDLHLLTGYEIPRCVKPARFSSAKFDIHVFGDASEAGYGAVAYLRCQNSDQLVYCSILLAKSRLAPLKKVTVPRLELAAAKLCVTIRNIIKSELDMRFCEEHYWTDSTIVLQCLNNNEKRFQRYVANRVEFIRDHSTPNQWHHVPSQLNPADVASRGQKIKKFIRDETWKRGPEFLWLPQHCWPEGRDKCQTNKSRHNVDAKSEEKEVIVCTNTETNSNHPIEKLISSSSCWDSLKRKVAWICRLIACWKIKAKTPRKLSLDDYKRSEEKVLQYVQETSFSKELKYIKQFGHVEHSSSLRFLNPIIDYKGLLRVGGRTRNANVPVEGKCPLILPKNHAVSRLIAQETHKSVGHLGRETSLSQLRQRYWILNANSLLRNIIKACVICRKINQKPCDQLMADLPNERVVGDDPPFTHVGVDFFGPFLISRKRSSEKRYGVIFNCLASRASHIEVAHSLDISSFINVLRRFLSRRGQVESLRSDNGTNLVGSEKELKLQLKYWNQERIYEFLRQKNIKWTFQPPTASHFGGVWERQIRTIRKLLSTLLLEQPIKLTDDSLSTLFCEIEAMLNSRPLTPVSSDPDDLEALTPNHLLLQKKGLLFPPGVFCKDDLYVKRRWRQAQYLANVFWSRWKREYLVSLNQRKKWTRIKPNVKIGDLVLLCDVNLPRNLWPLGRIVTCYESSDGLIRSVKVKTVSGVYDRPITKIVSLEVD